MPREGGSYAFPSPYSAPDGECIRKVGKIGLHKKTNSQSVKHRGDFGI